MEPFIQLPSGQLFWPFNPEKYTPSEYDIAHKLSQTNRYGGSCMFDYSVAYHSVLIAEALLRDGYSRVVALAALFHDAPEPFGFCDLPAPIKYGAKTIFEKLFVWLHQKFEKRILDSFITFYGITTNKQNWDIVKEYDARIINDEKKQCMSDCIASWRGKGKPLGVTIKKLTSQQAAIKWLELYNELR